MPAPTVVILAAGQGSRMRSALPKVLHPLCGRPMVLWPIRAAQEAGAERVVVVDAPGRPLESTLPDDVVVAVQPEPLGTGDAVRSAAPYLRRDAPVVVLSGDVPLVTASALAELVRAHEDGRAAATMATVELEDPASYGRVVRGADGAVERVVETKVPGDARPEELALREVNCGVYVFDGAALLDALGRLEPGNAQGELYLPDVLPAVRAAGGTVAGHRIADPTVMLGVNDRIDLARVRAVAQRRIVEEHLRAGVTVVDPAATLIDVDVELGQDTVVEPASFLRGETQVGERCRVGPATTLVDTVLGDEVSVPHSYLDGARVGDGASVGPFAYLRPGADLAERSKAGTFVEIKNSTLGPGAKVPHLSYVGDAEVGEGSNLGAGTITANYDGFAKHRTHIGTGVRVGVDTMLVAPVSVGDGAFTGAGSVIVEDVPPGALGIARERQRNVEGYVERVERRAG